MAAPEEVAPYVVYADWLQRQGDPRGELMSVQLALETARGAEWAELKLREAELVSEVGPWKRNVALDWRRGFVDRMRGVGRSRSAPSDEGVLAHPSLALVRALCDVAFGDAPGLASPLLHELEARRAPPAVFAHPALRRLRLSREAGGFAPPAHSRLEVLVYEGDAALLHALARCAFPALRLVQTDWVEQPELITGTCALLDATPAKLMLTTASAPPELAALRRIATRLCGLAIDDAEALRGLPLQPNWLRLGRITLEAMDAIPSSVRHLVLQQQLAAPLVAALVASPQVQRASWLRLNLEDPDALAGLGQRELPELRSLYLGWSWEGNAAADARRLLGWARALPRLDELCVDARTVHVFAASELAPRIETLRLSVRSPWVEELVPQLRRFTRLRTLYTSGVSPHGDAELVALGRLGVRIELGTRTPPFMIPREDYLGCSATPNVMPSSVVVPMPPLKPATSR